MADYLLYLSNNKTAYNSYFKWKKYITLIEPRVYSSMCDICIQLHLETHFGVQQKRIDDMKAFWGKNENCKHSITNSLEFADPFLK